MNRFRKAQRGRTKPRDRRAVAERKALYRVRAQYALACMEKGYRNIAPKKRINIAQNENKHLIPDK